MKSSGFVVAEKPGCHWPVGIFESTSVVGPVLSKETCSLVYGPKSTKLCAHAELFLSQLTNRLRISSRSRSSHGRVLGQQDESNGAEDTPAHGGSCSRGASLQGSSSEHRCPEEFLPC